MAELNPSHMFVGDVEYVTTEQAADRMGADVTTDMIRDWVKRGILKPAGRYGGRSNLYRVVDVAHAELRTRDERRGRKRRAGELQKIAEVGQNLPTDAQVNAAQKPARQTQCSVVGDGGKKCSNHEVPDAPFRICRDHLRAAYLHWKDHLTEVYGFDPTQIPGPGRLPGPEAPAKGDPHQPVVYYIRFGDRIKIGHTTNLYLRLAVLPHDELLAIEPGPLDLERMRQRQFAEHRISAKGEWFRVHPDLLAHTHMLVQHFGTAESQMEAMGRPAPPRKAGAAQ